MNYAFRTFLVCNRLFLNIERLDRSSAMVTSALHNRLFNSKMHFPLFFLAWLRNNCMEVFHYCAEVLKEMPLFESCTNEELFRLKREELRTGAVFNDYDGLVDQLLADSDFESESAGESTSSETTSEAELTFTEHEMDLYFLGADENDPQRWEKKHPLFTTHPDRIDEALYQLRKLSEEEWKKIPINCQDLTR